MAGTWNTFNAPSGVNADTMLLLTDGTVLVHDANRPSLSRHFGGANWYRLTPDSHGDYRNGTWSARSADGDSAPVLRQRRAQGRPRLSSSAASSPTSSATTDKTQDNDTRGEIFDPVSNTWSAMTKPSPGFDFIVGDCVSMRPRRRPRAVRCGRLGVPAPRSGIQSPTRWVAGGHGASARVANTKIGKPNEESWCLLPNGNVLTVQITGATATRNAEMYVPSNDSWVTAGVTPSDAAGRRHRRDDVNEIGGAVTLHERPGLLRRRQRPDRASTPPGATPTDHGQLGRRAQTCRPTPATPTAPSGPPDVARRRRASCYRTAMC